MTSIQQLALPDVKLIRPRVFEDARGFFVETLNEKTMQSFGLTSRFVQENQSYSRHAGTVRGLHLQQAPHAQAKLVRVLKGRIFDVAVDVRPHSPTYGQHVSAILSDEEIIQIFIPEGFAHGFCTLADDTMVLYNTTNFYVPEAEAGFLWNDPALNIPWPVDPAKAILSGKDSNLPLFHTIKPL